MKNICFVVVLYILFISFSLLGFVLALIFKLLDHLKFTHQAHKFNILAHYIIFKLPLRLMTIWKFEEKDGSYLEPLIIVVSNHFSLLDAPLIVSYFTKRNYRVIFIGRSGQDKIPFIGWSMKLLGHIFIEFKPGNKAVGNSVRLSMEQLRTKMKSSERIAVVFFGTGLMQDQKDDPLKYELKNGPFDLSKSLQISIVPVWLSGTDLAMPPSNPFWVSSATLLIRIGEEISPNASLDVMKLNCKIQLSRLKAQH